MHENKPSPAIIIYTYKELLNWIWMWSRCMRWCGWRCGWRCGWQSGWQRALDGGQREQDCALDAQWALNGSHNLTAMPACIILMAFLCIIAVDPNRPSNRCRVWLATISIRPSIANCFIGAHLVIASGHGSGMGLAIHSATHTAIYYDQAGI